MNIGILLGGFDYEDIHFWLMVLMSEFEDHMVNRIELYGCGSGKEMN